MSFPHTEQNGYPMAATVCTNAVARVLADHCILQNAEKSGVQGSWYVWSGSLDTFANADVQVAHMMQPYVQMTCEPENLGEDSLPETEYVSFGANTSNLDQLIRLVDLGPNATSLDRKLPVARVSQARINSTSLLVEVPHNVSHHSLVMVTAFYSHFPISPEMRPIEISACKVDAFWSRASANISKTSDFVIRSLHDDNSWPQSNSQIVQLSPKWVKWVFETFLETDSTAELATWITPATIALAMADSVEVLTETNTSIGQMSYEDQTDQSMNEEQSAAMMRYLSGQKMRKDFNEISVYASGNWTDPGSLLQVRVETFRIGYGYDSSKTPVKLSLTILVIYCLVALAYLLFIFISGQTANSWDTMGELVLLALNSRRPSHLSGTSAGTETLKTFREPVNVRANKEGSLEIVFADDPDVKALGYDMVVPNKRY